MHVHIIRELNFQKTRHVTHSKALILLGTGLRLIAERLAYVIDGYSVAIHVVPPLVASSWFDSLVGKGE